MKQRGHSVVAEAVHGAILDAMSAGEYDEAIDLLVTLRKWGSGDRPAPEQQIRKKRRRLRRTPSPVPEHPEVSGAMAEVLRTLNLHNDRDGVPALTLATQTPDRPKGTVYSCLSRLRDEGLAENATFGRWRLTPAGIKYLDKLFRAENKAVVGPR